VPTVDDRKVSSGANGLRCVPVRGDTETASGLPSVTATFQALRPISPWNEATLGREAGASRKSSSQTRKMDRDDPALREDEPDGLRLETRKERRRHGCGTVACWYSE
jgi:hypothetical protein